MQILEQKFSEIAAQLKRGVVPSPITAREVLGWIGASRRGSYVNWQIKQALEKAGLETQPEFEWAYIDGYITFVAIGSDADRKTISTINRIGGLESANRKPLSVKPDSSISEAITHMLKNNFSQLPVMTTERDVKGAITWKSIASKYALGQTFTAVRECMNEAQIVSADTSLFDAIGCVRQEFMIPKSEKIG